MVHLGKVIQFEMEDQSNRNMTSGKNYKNIFK